MSIAASINLDSQMERAMHTGHTRHLVRWVATTAGEHHDA